jgi:hypothetical protein
MRHITVLLLLLTISSCEIVFDTMLDTATSCAVNRITGDDCLQNDTFQPSISLQDHKRNQSKQCHERVGNNINAYAMCNI